MRYAISSMPAVPAWFSSRTAIGVCVVVVSWLAVLAPAAPAQRLLFELQTDTPTVRRALENFGWACIGLPDLDGDCVADLLIGAERIAARALR